MARPEPADQPTFDAELFRLLAEHVPEVAVFTADEDGRVRTWNRGAERLFGYCNDEVIGQPVDRFFVPEDAKHDLPHREMRRALDAGRAEADRWQVRRDGSRFWAACLLTPQRDEAGQLRGFAIVIRDIGERSRTESHRNARLAVTQVLAAAGSIQEAAPDVLRAVCETLGWDAGLFWILDGPAGVLRCLDGSHSSTVIVAEFEATSRGRTFRPRISRGPPSLPGKGCTAPSPAPYPSATKSIA